jgi:hypothetical protein
MTYTIDNDKDTKTLTVMFDPAIAHILHPNKSWSKLELHEPELEHLIVLSNPSFKNELESLMKTVSLMTKDTNQFWPEPIVKKLPLTVVEEIAAFFSGFRRSGLAT